MFVDLEKTCNQRLYSDVVKCVNEDVPGKTYADKEKELYTYWHKTKGKMNIEIMRNHFFEWIEEWSRNPQNNHPER